MRHTSIHGQLTTDGSSPPTGLQLVLVLSARENGPRTSPPGQGSRHRTDLVIEAVTPGGDPDTFRVANTAALRSWHRIGAEFCSACVGVVAEAGAAIAVVGQILSGGSEDGTLPGAIALLGYSADFVETCMSISRGEARSGRIAGTRGGTTLRNPRPSTSEWPPIVMFLAANDPGLAPCAAACRRLRSIGFDVRLEIAETLPAAGHGLDRDTLDVGSIDELDAFFDASLQPSFPHLPRDAP